ncbi:hypothetical protein EDD18DRAFT_1296024 [Armillaria luteobubalina]|uniref:Uncharacterized protein n=1 Tax=Armillaria luteobubalina TaxID=153913 RepID=A0AA39UGM8_9AGAR|nr:hypothetical protein EDD18DRAFT_1296024 [Armillaria luteobubalina]
MRLEEIVHNMKADAYAQKPPLLVLENADPSMELDKYLPYSLHDSILITSTNEAVSHFASGQAYKFKLLDSADQHSAGNLYNGNWQLASEIVNALGCQALAVATAGAYIASTATCTLSKYLSLFKQKSNKLLNYEMKSLDSYQKTVFSAFQLSFDRLQPSTQYFIQICAFFHHTAIPIELFHYASTFTGQDLSPEEKEKNFSCRWVKAFFITLCT